MRLKKGIICILVLLAALLLFCQSATAVSCGETFYVAVDAGSVLNLRQDSNTDARVLLELARGTQVTATGNKKNDWYEVEVTVSKIVCDASGTVQTTGVVKGWVYRLSLSSEMPYDNALGMIDSTREVILRSKPGGEVKSKLIPETIVTVLAVLDSGDGRWYRVETSDGGGWVMGDYVAVSL